jgi:hypothetical protein
MAVSLTEGAMGLGTMWGEQTTRQTFAEAGFTDIEAVHRDDFDAYIIAISMSPWLTPISKSEQWDGIHGEDHQRGVAGADLAAGAATVGAEPA